MLFNDNTATISLQTEENPQCLVYTAVWSSVEVLLFLWKSRQKSRISETRSFLPPILFFVLSFYYALPIKKRFQNSEKPKISLPKVNCMVSFGFGC